MSTKGHGTLSLFPVLSFSFLAHLQVCHFACSYIIGFHMNTVHPEQGSVPCNDSTSQGFLAYRRKNRGSRCRPLGGRRKIYGRPGSVRDGANGLLPVDRLVFLGYPLHPFGNKEKLRDAHLRRIENPMLFFAGIRDPLRDMEKLTGTLKQLREPWDLHTVDGGGDHSFRVPKTAGMQDEGIFARPNFRTCVFLFLRYLVNKWRTGG